jgi:VanZ family protein
MLWKAAFIGCVIALGALAWLPANAMMRTTLGGHAEHLIAYLCTATVMGFATRTTRWLVAQCLLLIGYAAILEAGQLYAIGRQASFQDFAFSSSGVLIGATLVWIARTWWVRTRILKPTFVEGTDSPYRPRPKLKAGISLASHDQPTFLPAKLTLQRKRERIDLSRYLLRGSPHLRFFVLGH